MENYYGSLGGKQVSSWWAPIDSVLHSVDCSCKIHSSTTPNGRTHFICVGGQATNVTPSAINVMKVIIVVCSHFAAFAAFWAWIRIWTRVSVHYAQSISHHESFSISITACTRSISISRSRLAGTDTSAVSLTSPAALVVLVEWQGKGIPFCAWNLVLLKLIIILCEFIPVNWSNYKG